MVTLAVFDIMYMINALTFFVHPSTKFGEKSTRLSTNSNVADAENLDLAVLPTVSSIKNTARQTPPIS